MKYSPEQYAAWEEVRAAGRRQLAVSKYWKLIMTDLQVAANSDNDELAKVLSECLDPISDLLTRAMQANTDAHLAFERSGENQLVEEDKQSTLTQVAMLKFVQARQAVLKSQQELDKKLHERTLAKRQSTKRDDK